MGTSCDINQRVPAPSLTANAVRRSLDEYDRMGPDAFLAKYGYGRAKEYFVERSADRYVALVCYRRPERPRSRIELSQAAFNLSEHPFCSQIRELDAGHERIA